MKPCLTKLHQPRYVRVLCNLSKRRILPLSILAIFILLMCGYRSEMPNKNYSAQANIIYHFTRYINWPSSKKTGDFIIAVAGNSPIYEVLLNEISHKLVNGRKIIVRKLSPSSLSFDCHILYLPENESRHIKRIAEQTESTHTLLVSEYDGLAAKGSCINFEFSGETLKLEINKRNIAVRQLAIATELLQLGTVIDYEP